MFFHENLQVYQRTLTFHAQANAWISKWDARHAICDHLPRAAGSMLENIAMGSAVFGNRKMRYADYALGSCLESAACLDLANIKGLLADDAHHWKGELCEIARMIVGLRKAWERGMVREGEVEYGHMDAEHPSGEGQVELFHHEKLDAYRVALQAAAKLVAIDAEWKLAAVTFRRLDTLMTSTVLNIAEGNGRYSTGDQERFAAQSHESAIKLAARLDLSRIEGLVSTEDVATIKKLLERVAQMTAGMLKASRQRQE